MALDTQQQAYLTTMGINLYEPQNKSKIKIKSVDTLNQLDDLDWGELTDRVSSCVECDLHSGRTQTVLGVGNQQADLLIIGEAPGEEEDRQGEPFVGHAGQLLNEMLKAIGFNRNQIYLTNILKCRPPNNRDPKAEEAERCIGYLYRQIELMQPKLVLAVGHIAAQQLLKTDLSLDKLRSQVHELASTQLPVIVTYHPADLLHAPGEKRKAWEDLLFVQQTLNNSNNI